MSAKLTYRSKYTDGVLEQNAKEIQIIMKANGFLHNMARMSVVTLMEIDPGKRDISVIDDIFSQKSEKVASATADARGFFQQKIKYG